MNEYINISQIENWLHGKLCEALGNRVIYPGSLPSVLADNTDMMTVIDVVRSTDTSEYGRVRGIAMVEVTVYVRPDSTGRKRVSKMNQIENALSQWVETERDPRYTVCELYGAQGYDNNIGYHFKRIMLQIQIH